MAKSRTEILLDYNDAIRYLVNSKLVKMETRNKSAETALQYIRRQFQFNQEDDWGRLCACMDLIEDTTLAIRNFKRYEIEGPTKYDELGEKYLRLYGVLNAVYLQQSAGLNMYKIFQVPKPSELKSKIDKLQITQLRHKLASHTVNYAKEMKGPCDYFIVYRSSLSGMAIEFMNYRTDRHEEVNLLEAIGHNTELMITTLDEVYEKSINTIYKTAKVRQAEFRQKLKLLRHACKGDIVIRLQEQVIIIQEMASKQKRNSVRGLVIRKWSKAGQPNWDIQKTITACKEADEELARKGLKPAPKFREFREKGMEAKIRQWAQGWKFPWL